MALVQIRFVSQGRARSIVSAARQRALLAGARVDRPLPQLLAAHGWSSLDPQPPQVMQLNLGRRCTEACRHDEGLSGPDRCDLMPGPVVEACLAIVARSDLATLELTGGAPELHPRFRELVILVRALRRRLVLRCNLLSFVQPGRDDLATFVADQGVGLAAWVPADLVRTASAAGGDDESIEARRAALRRLCELGYGRPGTGLTLDLLTSPPGPSIPGRPLGVEAEWRHDLERRHGIVFGRLVRVAKPPLGPFLEELEESGCLDSYLEMLANAFNPALVDALPCRRQLSVGPDGTLYNCELNQALETPLPQRIEDLDPLQAIPAEIRTGAHCLACVAGPVPR